MAGPRKPRTEDNGGTVRVEGMTRPALREVPLGEAWPLKAGEVTITMSVGQWDALLYASYQSGYILLELDGDEKPVRAYQRAAKA